MFDLPKKAHQSKHSTRSIRNILTNELALVNGGVKSDFATK